LPAAPLPSAARPPPYLADPRLADAGPWVLGALQRCSPGGPEAAAAAVAVGAIASRVRQRRSRAYRKQVAMEAARRDTLAWLAAATAAAQVMPIPPALADGDPPTVIRQVTDGVWVFDQAYGIPGLGVGANIPIRMMVMKLNSGGYLVYNPCNPTRACMQGLVDAGLTDIRYIVLGTIAIEHKYYAPQWSQQFPEAEMWISPRTFSWPIDFGAYTPFVGFPGNKKLNKIPKDSTLAPWYNQGVDHLQLTVDYAPRTVFEETVLFHRESSTFICTDMLIGLSDDPPEILTKSPYAEGLLWFSRNNPLDRVDTKDPATLRDGYQKSVLLLNNINPRSLLSVAAGDLQVPEQVGLALRSPQPELGYAGWYPCNWQENDSPCAVLDQRQSTAKASKSFDCRPGWRGEWARLVKGVAGTGFQVPSFVAELQVSRDPEALRGFADEIARRWPDIKRVVPSHFDAPLTATSQGVREAIASAADGTPGPPARTADLSAILNFRDYLEENDLIYKPKSGRGQWRPA